MYDCVFLAQQVTAGIDEWTSLGTGAIFAVLVLRMVLDFLVKKNGKDVSSELLLTLQRLNSTMERVTEKISTIEQDNRKLLRMHEVYDADGVPRWFVREGLHQSIKDLADHLEKKEKLINKLTESVDALCAVVAERRS